MISILRPTETVESILDKLVSEPTDHEQLATKPSQEVRPDDSEEPESQSKVDDGVLRGLTAPAKSALSETVTSESTGDTKPVKTVRDEDEQARRHVLDELTGADDNDGATENSDGDSDDA